MGKWRALDLLSLHFGSIGRPIYLAEEMDVLYPGEQVCVPDLLAVMDVAQPEDDNRMAWVVADEGKGPDLVIEVMYRGDRKKDLVVNVERYARLGIPEYFIYDRWKQKLHAHRLAGPRARRYKPIVPQHGRYPSTVLGLGLAVAGGKLRFFYGMAELFGTADLIDRLQGMVGDLEAKADEEARKREDVERRLAAALAELERRK